MALKKHESNAKEGVIILSVGVSKDFIGMMVKH